MTEQGPLPRASTAEGEARSVLPAGAILREAREAAGLSIDAVAGQLKLHPKQVRAIEEGDFALLPGRTFVRGFVRNYARLLQLDADTVIAALPGTAASPALDVPALHSTATTMGELPNQAPNGTAWGRWLIPLVLVAIAAALGIYEYLGSAGSAPGTVPTAKNASPALDIPSPEPGETVLPNPMAPAAPDPNAPVSGPVASAVSESPGHAANAPAGGTPATMPASGPETSTATLIVSLRGGSWVEVKDGSGRVMVSQTLAAGQRQAIAGSPPFDVTIGNAPEVTITYRGQPVDLGPYTRQNVARLTLK